MYDAVILIVDDEQTYLDTFAETLKEKNFKILQAFNGRMGCMVARKFMPDIIIVDWEMPEMNGIEMIEELKKDDLTQNIPVIMCTGIMTSPKNLDTALLAGAIDYIRKPVEPIELIARINSALKLSDSFKKINEQNNKLQLLNLTKDKLFGIIAHDLRNPFGGVQALADLLIRAVEAENMGVVKEYSRIIYEATIKGNYLLENLLHWSMMQQGNITYNPEYISLGQVAEKAISYICHVSDLKNVRIINKIDNQLKVNADLNMTEIILRNLISNALKFSYENGEIELTALQSEKSVTIMVKDDGTGIDEEQMQNLFALKLKSRYGTKNEKGAGLGLNLCQEFVEIQGGKIWAESKPGQGSMFRFTLPL